MQHQLEQQAREIGAPAPQPLQRLVAPFTGPGEAIANLTPQISYFSQKQGGPALQVADIQEVKPLQGNMQDGLAALVEGTRRSRHGTW